jgi:periplasmic copper chaperone A
MSAPLSTLTRRAGAAAAVSVIGLLALAGPASAHVTVAADDSTQGAGDAILTFRVPNEQDAATTTKLDIKFPVQNPIASVKPASIPGWVVTTTSVKFNPPIKTDDGTITAGVGEVSYTAAPGNKGIPIGGFGAFQILVGPLPDTNQVVFSAVQTYSNGKVAAWIEPVTDPANPPANPTPILALHAATSAGTMNMAPASVAAAPAAVALSRYATQSDVNTARTLGITGLIAGVLGLVVGAIAIGRGRRTAAPASQSTPH